MKPAISNKTIFVNSPINIINLCKFNKGGRIYSTKIFKE